MKSKLVGVVQSALSSLVFQRDKPSINIILLDSGTPEVVRFWESERLTALLCQPGTIHVLRTKVTATAEHIRDTVSFLGVSRNPSDTDTVSNKNIERSLAAIVCYPSRPKSNSKEANCAKIPIRYVQLFSGQPPALHFIRRQTEVQKSF